MRSLIPVTALFLPVALGCAAEEASVEGLRYSAEEIEVLPELRMEQVFATDPDAPSLFVVTGATRRDDGTVVVAHRSSAELIVLNEDGDELIRFGGEGDGPGEFRGLTGVWRNPDGQGLLAWDFLLRRLTEFDDSGQVEGTYGLSGNYSNHPRAIGVLEDRYVLVHEHFRLPGTELTEFTLEFLLASREGEVIQRWGPFPWSRMARNSGSPGGAVVPQVFDVTGRGDASSTRLFYTEGGPARFVVVELESGEMAEVEWEVTPRPVTEELLNAWEQRELDRLGSTGRGEARRLIEGRLEIGVVSTLPEVEDVAATKGGGVWIKRFDPRVDSNAEWLVFNRELRPTSKVVLARSTEVLEVGSDYALLLTKDGIGRETIELVELSRESKAL